MGWNAFDIKTHGLIMPAKVEKKKLIQFEPNGILAMKSHKFFMTKMAHVTINFRIEFRKPIA